MKNLVSFSIILFSVLVFSAQSQTTPAKAVKGSVIQFAEKSHDFGTIDEGIKVSCDFEFTNTGDSDLVLLNVQASCGCTVPTWPRKPIKPGDKGKITVVYNSARRAGETFHQSITVTSNMLQDNVKVIYIKGQVAYKTTPALQQTAPAKVIQN